MAAISSGTQTPAGTIGAVLSDYPHFANATNDIAPLDTAKDALANIGGHANTPTIYDHEAVSIFENETIPLSRYRNDVLLIVNVATF